MRRITAKYSTNFSNIDTEILENISVCINSKTYELSFRGIV